MRNTVQNLVIPDRRGFCNRLGRSRNQIFQILKICVIINSMWITAMSIFKEVLCCMLSTSSLFCGELDMSTCGQNSNEFFGNPCHNKSLCGTDIANCVWCPSSTRCTAVNMLFMMEFTNSCNTSCEFPLRLSHLR